MNSILNFSLKKRFDKNLKNKDAHFVYIVLEICRKKSLMELHKRRGALTEPEVRYYMKQISQGVGYLHDHDIIHRDLKLGKSF